MSTKHSSNDVAVHPPQPTRLPDQPPRHRSIRIKMYSFPVALKPSTAMRAALAGRVGNHHRDAQKRNLDDVERFHYWLCNGCRTERTTASASAPLGALPAQLPPRRHSPATSVKSQSASTHASWPRIWAMRLSSLSESGNRA